MSQFIRLPIEKRAKYMQAYANKGINAVHACMDTGITYNVTIILGKLIIESMFKEG